MDKRAVHTPACRCAAALLPILAVTGMVHADVPNDDCATAQVVTDAAPAAERDNSQASVTGNAEVEPCRRWAEALIRRTQRDGQPSRARTTIETW